MNSPGVGGEQGAGDAAQLHPRPRSPQVFQLSPGIPVLPKYFNSTQVFQLNLEYISLRNLLTKSFQGRFLHCGGGEEAEEVKDSWVFVNQSVPAYQRGNIHKQFQMNIKH